MTALDDGWTFACLASDLSKNDGKMEVVMPDGKPVLLIRMSDGLIACSADCPHQDSPLIEGHVDGCILTCPVHFWQWDLRTGEARGPAEMPLPLYDVRQDGENLLVRFPPSP